MAARGGAAPGPAAGGALESARESKEADAAPKQAAPAPERLAGRADSQGSVRDQIRGLAERLGGGMSEWQEDAAPGGLGAVLVSLPPGRYGELLEGLRQLGAVQDPLPAAPAARADGRAEVVIRLLAEESKR